MAHYPEDFLLGASTAAYQVEGNNANTDFWTMEHLKHTMYKEPSLDAVDHYRRYEEDIKLLAGAGLNAYRFSIEWARIQPEEDRFDEAEIAHYRDVLNCCRENGVTPVVTLHHFSSPKWLIGKGGWGSRYVISAFAAYCRFVMERLGSLIPYACTINEANIGYQLGEIAKNVMRNAKRPGSAQVGVRFDLKGMIAGMFEQGRAFGCSPLGVKTFHSPRGFQQETVILEAHRAAVAAIRQVSPSTKVGLTLSLYDYQPLPGGEEKAQALWDSIFTAYLPYCQGDDFLGVQNYTRKRVDENGALPPAPEAKLTQMGYEDYPASIAHVVRKVARQFPGEILVTEHGIATDDDARRQALIREALTQLNACIADGVKLKGYLHWSLLDNFEWQLGFSITFGLIAVDRTTQTRHPKQSLYTLGQMRS